ncbi:hypothetical protein [Brevundimonas naejangsanensis]|uniref:hypothetical protein n=1 Tax=Brevundimonas naejangsanensis TaxID=588932 RepID=UPI00106B91D0|nr:hypothetical protein [Brevundimonas naejangsanensis]QBQ49557.1 hypothetical protein E3U41_13200 [Brevundimonas naejangsanensis]
MTQFPTARGRNYARYSTRSRKTPKASREQASRTLTINSAEAATVKLIYHLYTIGVPYRDISPRLMSLNGGGRNDR